MRIVELDPDVTRREENLVRWVKQMYESSKRAKESLVKKWDEFYDFYRGKQWPGNYATGSNKWRSDIVINHIFATVETIIPNYLEANPRVYVYPKNPEFEREALLLERVKDHIWERTKMRLKLGQVGLHVCVYGTSILMVSWDNQEDDLRVDTISPRNFFPDPDALDIEDAEFVVWARPASLYEIKRRWPERGEDVQAEEVDPDIERPEILRDSGRTGYGVQTPTETSKTVAEEGTVSGRKTTSLVPTEPRHRYHRERVTLYECWVRDSETSDVRIDEETGEPREAPRYPGGRRIYVAGNVLLEDGPNPYEHGMFPFVKILNYQLDDSFWGAGDVEQLIPLQKEINKTVALFVDHRNTTLQPHWLIPKGCLVSDHMSNKPGGETIYDPQRGKPEIANDSRLPGWLTRFQDARQMDVMTVSGVNDAIRGRAPGRVESGRGIIALQEKDLTRLRKKSANLEEALQKFFTIVLKCAQELYEPETKTIRIAGQGMRDAVEMIRMSELLIDFDIKVESGSTLPHNPESDQEAVTALLQAGSITPDQALELLANIVKVPGMMRILEEKKALAAQQAQQPPQGGPQPEGQMPPGEPMGMPPGMPM